MTGANHWVRSIISCEQPVKLETILVNTTPRVLDFAQESESEPESEPKPIRIGARAKAKVGICVGVEYNILQVFNNFLNKLRLAPVNYVALKLIDYGCMSSYSKFYSHPFLNKKSSLTLINIIISNLINSLRTKLIQKLQN